MRNFIIRHFEILTRSKRKVLPGVFTDLCLTVSVYAWITFEKEEEIEYVNRHRIAVSSA